MWMSLPKKKIEISANLLCDVSISEPPSSSPMSEDSAVLSSAKIASVT
jgi:hypothetical protein